MHHNEIAREHVNASVPRARWGDTVADCHELLKRQRFDIIDVVLVTGDANRFAGTAPLTAILAAAPQTEIGTLIDAAWPIAPPELDQEKAVEIAITAGVTVLPVVDDGYALGCITAASLIEILAAEHREDVHRMAGILRERRNERHELVDPPTRRFARRFPWLLVGLALSSVGTAVMAGFEATLQANVAVTFFIPALVYLTDAIGTQTEAIAVRGLSIANQRFAQLLLNEITTGALIGAALGLLAVLGIWLVFGNIRIALAVGCSLLVAGSLASAIGLTLPWLLSRYGVDPALGSGPVATVIQDVLTLLVYFSIVAAALG